MGNCFYCKSCCKSEDGIRNEEEEAEYLVAKKERLANIKGLKKKDLEENGQYYFEPNMVDDSSARDENFFESICLLCCPAISWGQFVVIISLVEFGIFIISCCIYGVSNEEFLSPDPHALEILGW